MITTRANPRLDDIAPSPTNPRKHFAEADLAELANSIKEHGIISPILLRTSNSPDPKAPYYELISGERRWRAARLAGLETIPADVRDNLSDTAVVEIQLIENLQRQDLHPLEEAQGYGHMMRDHGYTADTLAERIGKSRSYIFGRLKLLDLSEDGQRLFYGGALNPSTALLVARIPSHKLQAKAIEDLTRTDYYGDTKSVREAQRWIRDRYMLALDKAPFPTEDRDLIATAGPCQACPMRTGNSPDLFDDIDSTNVCTDPDCYTAKKLAAAERRAREAGPDVTVVTGEEAEKMLSWSGNETKTHAPLDAKCYDDPQHRTYREILGDDAKAVALVENRQSGDLVPVVAKKVVTEKLKAQGIVTQAQQTREDNKKIKAQVALANAFREALFKTIRDRAPANARKIPVLEVLVGVITRRFLIDAGNTRAENVAGLWGAIGANSWDRTEAFRNGLNNYTADDQLRICLDLALLAELKTDEHNLKREPEGMLAMAKALDIDTDALLKATREAQKPAPKGKKTPKKAAPDPSAEPPYPSEAAQAAEADRAKTGQPETPAATEAALAGGAEAVEDENSGATAPNETPTGDRPAYAIGDRVRFKDGLTWDSGDPWPAAGKSGFIEIAHGNDLGYSVRIDEGGLFAAAPNEIDLVQIKAGDIESDEEPTAPTGDEVAEPHRQSTKVTIKYRHPEESSLCWTGRGRQPKWVENWLAEGGTLEQLTTEGATA